MKPLPPFWPIAAIGALLFVLICAFAYAEIYIPIVTGMAGIP
jgi:hypothetical protein